MMKPIASALAALGFAALGFAGTYLALERAAAEPALRPVWTEIQWPFPLDEWGIGKAFGCRALDCGSDVELYLRAKIGFCNCTTGVADDEELERVADFDLLGQPTALGPGRAVAVGAMNGRSRPYSFANLARTGKSSLTIAFNEHCDVIVATAVIGRDQPQQLEPVVLEFLNGDTVMRWAEATLGL
jgi:hypothetical protein